MSYKELSDEQIKLIKKPLPKEAVKDHPTKKGMSTIKAIYVTERLNDVFGIGRWTIRTSPIPIGDNGEVFRKTTYTTSTGKERTEFFAVTRTVFEVPAYGISYECIAGASNDDIGDAFKGSTTDAITKICSYIGIGIDVFKGEHDAALAKYSEEKLKAKDQKYYDDIQALVTAGEVNAKLKAMREEGTLDRYKAYLHSRATALKLTYSTSMGCYGETVAPTEEEINKAIADLVDCHTVADFSKLKSELPSDVATNPKFKEAALARYNQLNPTAQPA